MKSGSLINNYVLLLGIFMLAEGIWGLFSDVVFGFMTTNKTHAVIHIALGITGIILSVAHKAYLYCILTGALLVVVGLLYMIPSTKNLSVQLLNLNGFVAVFNVVAGLIALLVAYVGKRYEYINQR